VEEPPKNSPLTGLPNVIATPHVAGSTGSSGRVGTQVAVQVRDYLAEGIIRNAVNFGAVRRPIPSGAAIVALAERLGSFVAQAAQTRPARIRIRYAGEVAEVGTHLLRSAVLTGLLNAVLDEKVNVVNAPQVAAARRLRSGRGNRRREHGFPNTLEVSALPDKGLGCIRRIHCGSTVLARWIARVLQINGYRGIATGRHDPLSAQPR